MVLCILLTLFACAKTEPTRLTNITGLIPDLTFELTDENGNKVCFLASLLALKFAQQRCINYRPY